MDTDTLQTFEWYVPLSDPLAEVPDVVVIVPSTHFTVVVVEQEGDTTIPEALTVALPESLKLKVQLPLKGSHVSAPR